MTGAYGALAQSHFDVGGSPRKTPRHQGARRREPTMSKITDKAAREAAEREGVLGDEVRGLPVRRWPQWARARYAGQTDRSAATEVADPWTVDEAGS